MGIKKTLPQPQLQVCRNYSALCQSIAEQLVRTAQKSIDQRGVFNLALAGGSTPQGVYEVLCRQKYQNQTDWSRVHVFWGDERWVPAIHAHSNSRMASSAWLSKSNIPSKNIHPIPTQAATPSKGALQYEEKLRAHFRCARAQQPVFDLILLGLGEDGHVASLFPRHKVLDEKKRCVRAVTIDNPNPRRITLTLPVIRNARAVWVLVSGKKKAKILAQSRLRKTAAKRLPVQLAQPKAGDFLVFADREAAGQLKSGRFFPGAPSAK